MAARVKFFRNQSRGELTCRRYDDRGSGQTTHQQKLISYIKAKKLLQLEKQPKENLIQIGTEKERTPEGRKDSQGERIPFDDDHNSS